MNVLLLEDTASVREFYSDILSKEVPCTVIPADSIEAAKEKCSNIEFDLIIVDIHLKEKEDGVDFVNWFCSEYASAVILYTGLSASDLRDKFKKLRFKYNLLIKKPIHMDFLVEQVREIGNLRSSPMTDNIILDKIDKCLKAHRVDCEKSLRDRFIKKNPAFNWATAITIMLISTSTVAIYYKDNGTLKERIKILEMSQESYLQGQDRILLEVLKIQKSLEGKK